MSVYDDLNDFEIAKKELIEDPNKFLGDSIMEKVEYLTRIVTQNDYANRIESPENDWTQDFEELIELKLKANVGGVDTKIDVEKYNEIARRQTAVHPMVETKTDLF